LNIGWNSDGAIALACAARARPTTKMEVKEWEEGRSRPQCILKVECARITTFQALALATPAPWAGFAKHNKPAR
jgi:hypothetical protein